MRFQGKSYFVRPKVAVGAAIAASLICAGRHHVHIVLSEPGTYQNVLHHKCGLLMLVCVSWAALELAVLAGRGLRVWSPQAG